MGIGGLVRAVGVAEREQLERGEQQQTEAGRGDAYADSNVKKVTGEGCPPSAR